MNLNFNEETNFLQCYICMEKVKKARMCPHCSKLACYQCLRNWIDQRRNQCPHCRRIISLHNFADCERFIDDLMNVFKKIEKIQKPKQFCKDHKLQMHYYCNLCSEAICSDCGMFSEKHKGHHITHLRDIYEKQKSRILSQMTKFDQKIEEYKQNSNFIKHEIQKLIVLNEQKKGYLGAYFANILQKLQTEFQQKHIEIIEKYKENQNEIELLQNVKQQLLQNLEDYTQNQVIIKTNQILENISQICSKQVSETVCNYNFTTIHQIVPQYLTFQYQLKNFSNLDENIVYSDYYFMNGIQWRLKIYPKGNGVAKQKCISVFLEMTRGYENDSKYEYKIQLINKQKESQSVIREYSSKFDIGQCWGYNQFIELQLLNQGFLVDDCLKFKFYIRNPNYRCLSGDQGRYIQKLQLRVKQLQRLVLEKNLSKVSESKIILKQKQLQNSELKLQNLKNQTFFKKQQLKNQLLGNNQIQYEFLNRKYQLN